MASFPPPDQHKTSSMVSGWPVVAFNNPFEEELKNLPPAIVGSDGVSLIAPPLSSQASMGGSSRKVSKRRLKPATKPPIRVLSTDTSNFREIVHEITGMQPTSPLTQGIRFQQLWRNNPSPVLKPNATCSNSQHDAAGAAVAQTLPPALEYTSSAYDLLPPQKALMHDDINNINIDLAFRQQSLQQPQPHMADGSLCNSTAFYTDERGYYHPSSSGVDLKPLFARQCDASKNTSMCMERAVGEVSPEMQDMEQVLQPAELESLLIMGDNNLDDLFPCKVLHNVDSWLPSDAIHMELAYAMTFYGSLANYCEGD